MNKLIKGLVVATALVAIPVSGFAATPKHTMPPSFSQTQLSQTPAAKAAPSEMQIAQIYCATIRWPTFKKGGRDPFVTSGGGDGTTYCYISWGLAGAFLVY